MMTLPEIQAAIASAEARKASLVLPNLIELHQQVNYLTTQTIFDPARKADLQSAMFALDEAKLQHEKAREIDSELATLKDQLQQAEYDNRQALKQLEKQRKQDALNEFNAAALATVRAARRCMNMGVSPGKFHFQFLSSPWNSEFMTSDEMGFGLLPFEVKEKEAA